MKDLSKATVQPAPRKNRLPKPISVGVTAALAVGGIQSETVHPRDKSLHEKYLVWRQAFAGFRYLLSQTFSKSHAVKKSDC